MNEKKGEGMKVRKQIRKHERENGGKEGKNRGKVEK